MNPREEREFERRPSPRRRAGDGLAEESTQDLVRELVDEGRRMIREQVRLAKADLRAEAKKAGLAGGVAGVGGAILYAGVLTFAAFLVSICYLFLPMWLSTLIVAAGLMAFGGVMALVGAQRMRKVRPDRTIENLKEDQRWAKDVMQSARSQVRGNA